MPHSEYGIFRLGNTLLMSRRSVQHPARSSPGFMKPAAILGLALLVVLGFFLFRFLRRTDKPVVAAGDYQRSIMVDGRTRTYLLHLPKGYSPESIYPLVMIFHGGGGSGKKIAGQTGFSDYADGEGFIAVYPDGIKHGWNDGRDSTDAYRAGVDDVKFVRLLVEDLKGEFLIDGKGVYAAGISNGGFFSQRLACEMADVFAAIGTVVASMPTEFAPRCSPAAPIAIAVIQGTEDPFVPITGGEVRHKTLGIGAGGAAASAAATLEFWAEKNLCAASPVREALPVKVSDGTSVEKTVHSSCQDHAAVEYYIVSGMGHGWPPKGGRLPRVNGPASQNIDATAVFWQFFKAHPKS